MPHESNVIALEPLPHRLALVRCDGCGTEWADIEAALHSDGFSAYGCPNGCACLTTPVFDWRDGVGWVRR
jgi:hypothetical protein